VSYIPLLLLSFCDVWSIWDTFMHEPLCFDAVGVGWVAGRASGRYKTEWWGAGVVICLDLMYSVGANLHMAQLMPLPLTVSCFSKIQTDFIFLVLAHPGSLGKRAVKCVCVCVRACVRVCV